MTVDPVQIVKWFVLRWQTDVTYTCPTAGTGHEVREHLGIETQGQWLDRAILRTTPALLGLFSLVTLLAHQHARRRQLPIRQAAWYHKAQPTFSDALALVRRQIWQHECFRMADPGPDYPKLSAHIQDRLLSALCYTP